MFHNDSAYYDNDSISRRVDVRQAAVKINAESLSQHDENMSRPHLVG
jgi:hypothetical protein